MINITINHIGKKVQIYPSFIQRQSTRDLKVSVRNLSPNAIEFEFGLLKTQEHFKFDALATVPGEEPDKDKQLERPPNVRLRNALSFDFRIADAGIIKKLKLSDLQARTILPLRLSKGHADNRLPRVIHLYSWLFSSAWLPAALVVIGIVLAFLLKFNQTPRIAYEVINPEGQKVITMARVKKGQIELYSREGFRKLMSIEEFDKLNKTNVIQMYEERMLLFVPLSYSALGALMLLIWFVRYIRSRKYRRILGLGSEEANQ